MDGRKETKTTEKRTVGRKNIRCGQVKITFLILLIIGYNDRLFCNYIFIEIFRRLQKSNEFIAKLMRSELSNEWLQTLEENLNLLEEEKKTKLKGIILNMREELRNIWDKLYYGQVNMDVVFRQ